MPSRDDDDDGETSNGGSIWEEESADGSEELTGCQVVAYGIGHFYNDLCASMWFTYLLLFLEKVILMRSSLAGLIMLIGQTSDALSTAFIGVLSDWTSAPLCLRTCGQRKSWHVAGTVVVTFSFAFIYSKCFLCSKLTTDWGLFAWYTPFVIVFQVGWAAVQVSHLALLPELTSDESLRTSMNSARYGSTVISNLVIFIVLSALLHFDDSGSAIGPLDLRHFNTVAITVVVLGLFSQIFFYKVTKEPLRIDRTAERQQLSILRSLRLSLFKWMCRVQFYQVGTLYVLCRLYINLSQVYFPFYITHIRNLSKKYIAVLPMVSYCSSLLVSFLIGLPFLNRRLSLKGLVIFGCLCGISNCITMRLDVHVPIFIIAMLLGAAQAVLLIASLSAVAKLISQDTGSGAFVYGTLSSMDKISNGIALQTIELLSPPSCITSRSAFDCASFYRVVVIVVPGSCLLVAVFVLFSLVMSENCYLPPQQMSHAGSERLIEDSLPNSSSNQ